MRMYDTDQMTPPRKDISDLAHKILLQPLDTNYEIITKLIADYLNIVFCFMFYSCKDEQSKWKSL